MSTKPKPPLRSGVLAKLVGLSPDTLRLYERKGLLRPLRSANGYRSYPPAAVERIRLIRAALSIGFTLDELAEVLTTRDGGGVPCAHVRELAGAKLDNLDRHIGELRRLRDQLSVLVRSWDQTLRKTPHGKPAGLLEALAGDSASSSRGLALHVYRSLAGKSIRKEPRK